MDRVIGVDFDNTLVSYDGLMHAIAVQEGWLSPDAENSKRQIRDQLRTLADGETLWQRLQARAYGSDIRAAALIDGVRQFLDACRRRSATVYIISHKTEFAAQDDTGTDLREAALAWMDAHRFFAPDGLGLPRGHVVFESTRRAKVEQISALGCTHYIDDLEETFLEEGFPGATEKILYAPHGGSCSIAGVRVCRSWGEIHDHVFGAEG